MNDLRPETREFARRAWPDAEPEILAGDASTRRFYRLHRGDETAILMDYGAPFAGETDDMRMIEILRSAGLPAPRVLEALPNVGCLVLQDLGDRTLESAYAESVADAGDLLSRAVRLAGRVARDGTAALSRSERASSPALDGERFRYEMDFFLEHYVGNLLGRADLKDEARPALYRLADEAAATPHPVLCHRDFHSRNLMVDKTGEVWMVDVQDARRGPDSYDLASLLRDAYADIDDRQIDPMIDLYLSVWGEPVERAPFVERFRIVSAQRMIKALGTFGYQAAVRGRRQYLSAVPRTLDRLDLLLGSHPSLADLDRDDLFRT
jgi:aminoglycoside/choline kinase family phosphotransferase